MFVRLLFFKRENVGLNIDRVIVFLSVYLLKFYCDY